MENNMIPFAVYESMQVKDERVIKRLIIALIISVCLIFATNAIWLWVWLQFDYVIEEVEVDSEEGGDANYIGNDGNIYNGEGGEEV